MTVVVPTQGRESERESVTTRRRSLLRTAGVALSVGGGCLGRLTRKRRVPVLTSDGTTVRSERVSRTWYRHVREVRRARRALGSEFLDERGVDAIRVVRSDDRYGGRRGLEVTVELSRPISLIPSELQGITVATEAALPRGLSACFNEESFNPVPGGVVVQPVADGRFGTACCRAVVDGEPRLLTAAHLWDACRTAPQGEPLYQSDRRIGRVTSFRRDYDIALVDPDEGTDLADSIKLNTDRRLPVSGSLTEWGVALFLSEGRQVVNMGVSSGLTRGRLSAAYVEEGWNRCVDFDGHGVEARYRNVEGDSGGPVFAVHEGDAYLVAPQQMWVDRLGTDCGDNVVGDRGRGTAAYHLTDELGVRFGA